MPTTRTRWCKAHRCRAEEVGDATCAHTSLQSNEKAPQAAAEGWTSEVGILRYSKCLETLGKNAHNFAMAHNNGLQHSILFSMSECIDKLAVDGDTEASWSINLRISHLGSTVSDTSGVSRSLTGAVSAGALSGIWSVVDGDEWTQQDLGNKHCYATCCGALVEYTRIV